jgi:hypothetical protein
VTVGAMVAAELYSTRCPVVLAAAEDWPRIVESARIAIRADEAGASLELLHA